MKKLLAITLALSVVLTVAGPASAVTIEDLLAQIAELQRQIALLQGGQPSGTGACAGITSLSRNLSQGMSGTDVKCVQSLFNTSSDTQVAFSGAGSPGNETTYFGTLTRAAAVKFQVKNGVPGTGFVGPLTRAKLNLLLSTIPTPTPSTSGTPTPATSPTGDGLTVSLASDNPASTTVVDGQGVAPLAKFTFTNGDNAEVKITTLKLKRIGVSADATLTKVYLFDGAVRVSDSASVSSGVITFNDSTGLFKVGSGASKTITVKSDIDGTSGETLGVAINAAADIVSNSSSVKGTYPLNGNLMTLATATLAGVNFNDSTTPTGTPTVDPQDDYTVWQNITTITTRAVDLSRMSFREIGSIQYSDLKNFELYIDGVKIGSTVAELDANGYVTFDLSAAPKRLEAGARTIKVLADIINGSSRTFSFSLREAADANFMDTQYGVTVLPQANSTTFTARTTGTLTVNSGTLTITKTADSPSGDIVDAASNATLGKFTLKAAGERVKIETLYVSVLASDSYTTTATTVGYLRNGMLLANGVQVGSTSNLYENSYTTAYTTFSLGSSLIVEPGSPVTLEVRADVYDADGTNNIGDDDTLQVRIEGSADWNNAQGMSSLSTVDVPASDVDGNVLTVQQGGLTLSKYTAYTDQTMVPPVTAGKLGHFTLTANTTEDVNVTTIQVDLGTITYSNVTNLYVKYGTQTSSVKATTAESNSWSINYTLTKGTTIDVEVYADIPSGYSGTGDMEVLISGTTVGSATAVNTNSNAVLDGQTITFGVGSFTTAVDTGTPLAAITAGSKTVTAGKFKFTAASEDYTIKELKFTVPTNGDKVILSGQIKDGSTVVREGVTFDATQYWFTGLNIAVPKNSNKTLTLEWVLSVPSADYSTSQLDVKPTMSYVKYANSQGTESTSTTTRAANSLYVYRSIPTFTVADLASSSLTNGVTTELYKFNVAADTQGDVSLKQLKFSVTISDSGDAATLLLDTFKFYRGTTDLTTSSVVIQDTAGGTLESTTTALTESGTTTSTVVVTFTTEETIPAGQTYTYSLKARASAFAASTTGNDSVSTYLVGDTSAHNGTDVYVYDSTIGSIYQLAEDNSATGASAYNVIWSDRSALAHSYTTAASTNDWANGYLVLNLDLDAKGVTAQ